jgi:hypothetical protein
MMAVFTALNFLLAGWITTFASDVYRAVFLAWTFLAVLSVGGLFVSPFSEKACIVAQLSWRWTAKVAFREIIASTIPLLIKRLKDEDKDVQEVTTGLLNALAVHGEWQFG